MLIHDLYQPWQIWGSGNALWHRPRMPLTDSQNGRGGKGPLEVTWSKPPAQPGPPRAGCPALCPMELLFLMFLSIEHNFLLNLSKVLNQSKHLGKMCGDEDLTRLKRKCHKYFFLSRSYGRHQKTSDRLQIKQKRHKHICKYIKYRGEGRRNALNNILNWLSLSSNWKHCWCNTARVGPRFSSNRLAILWPSPCSRLLSFRSIGYNFIWKSKELRDGLCSLSGMLNCFKNPWQGLGPNQAMLSQTRPTSWELVLFRQALWMQPHSRGETLTVRVWAAPCHLILEQITATGTFNLPV